MPGPPAKYAITLAPEQEARLPQLRTCYLAPFATVQRAQIVLLAHHHPEWQNAASAQRLGCKVNTVKRWRQRWQTTGVWHEAPRLGTQRTFTPLPRAQSVALACSAPVSTASPGRAGRARSWHG